MKIQLPDKSQKISNLLAVFKNSVKMKFPDEENKMYLFGSYARGKFNDESDIDIIVLFKETSAEKENAIFDIKSELTYEYDKYFSVLTDTQIHFDKTNIHSIIKFFKKPKGLKEIAQGNAL